MRKDVQKHFESAENPANKGDRPFTAGPACPPELVSA